MNEEFSIDHVIAHMEATEEASWRVDTVRGNDGTNCFFGHLFQMAEPDEEKSNRLWNWFEATVATTYMVYPVNDGQNPAYPQPTPKQRMLSYLQDLKEGRAKTTEALFKEYAALP